MKQERLDGKLVTVFGGGGFVGRATAQALLARGARVRVAQRNPRAARDVRALGNLGQVQFAAADIRDAATVRAAVAGCDIVVNLVGSWSDMDDMHISGARHIAEAARDAGVPALIHVSTLGADADSTARYISTKGRGEDAVRSAFPAATILRPAAIFGRDDALTNRFAKLLSLPVFPVIAPNVKMQPVWVGDVAEAVATVAARSATPQSLAGQTLDIAGPQVVTMTQLVEQIARMTERSPTLLAVPNSIAAVLAKFTGWLPGAPLSQDQFAVLENDNVSSDNGLSALGIVPKPIAAIAGEWLTSYRKAGRFTVSRT